MRRQTKLSMKPQVARRSAFYLLIASAGTLLAFFRPEASTTISQGRLSFAERVGYQRTIEEIYWRHRIWPKENPNPKPSLDAVMSRAQLEKKVSDYLRNSQALDDYLQRPLTSHQLQAEMDRMAKHTRQPEVLHELFETLGNDPLVIAECLARPALAERFVANLRLTGASRGGHGEPWQRDHVSHATTVPTHNYTLPTISSRPDGCIDDTWTPTSPTNVPSGREYHTAVWTGSEMIVWGGNGFGSLNTGARYNPSMDNWTATSNTNAPTARFAHTAVWTGNEMIVWGGSDNSTAFNTGGRYNPSTDTWTSTSTTNAPSGRYDHTAVWSGSEMIVWGGTANFTNFNTGGRYDPNTNTWTPTTTTNAPEARYWHTAVWTGSEMIVWAGWNGSNTFNTGAIYNPGTNSWTATATTSAPAPRIWHSAVWTGSEMIVWGGSVVGASNTGGRYSPDTGTWATTSTTNAPSARVSHTAVWTAAEMVIWGGADCCTFLNIGGRYNPLTDSWTATTVSNAPDARRDHTAVWTGSEMLVWGGDNNMGVLNTGGRYCATLVATPTPTPTESCLVEQVSLCNSVVNFPPTDFTVQMSCPIDSVRESGFMVNNVGPDSFTVSKNTVTFHYNTSPAVPGGNYIHILLDAIVCCLRPVSEFTCTFTYIYDTPTPTPTRTPRVTPMPRARPTPLPRPTP